ncbi:TolC family protein [Sphingomonas sp. 37zxx]|uniref:TolC family protein n=1 Tax=Sphingomonas sp. 37zxx TaxID=1550073 RepID=UPI00053BE421|nr:TolC family protein [Sphingomonas sp. 37zxx]
MGFIRKLLLASAALTGVTTPANADSLGQAIADAYRNNPQLESQRAQLRALDETVIQAASPYRLNASVVTTMVYQEQDQRNVFDSFATLRERQSGISLTARQILLNGGRTAAQVSAAEAGILSGRERLREVENFILLEVVDSYVSVRRDIALVAIQQQAVDSYQRQVRQAQARERGGDLTRTDIAQAEAQLQIIRSQLVQAQAALQNSRARFAAVVGRNADMLDPEPALPGLPVSLDAAYQVAEQESPTLWQAILNERAGRDRIAAERAERNPVFAIEGSYGYNAPSFQTRDLGQGILGRATLTIPILTAGVVDSRVRAAIASQQALQFQIEVTRRAVDVALQNAWNQSISARDQEVAGERAVTAAQQALEGVRRGFAEGFRSNFEVLDSEQRLLNAQLILANARYLRYASQANLLAYLGRLEAAAVDEAVAIYDKAVNLRQTQAQQFDPFQPIVQPLDKLSRSSDRGREAVKLEPATGATVRPANVPPPSGDLSTTLPVNPGGRPIPIGRDVTPPSGTLKGGTPRDPAN